MKVQISIQKRRYKGKITGYTVVPCQIVNGVRKRIGCKTFKTEAEAKAYKKALALSIESGRQALPNTITVKEVAEIWLESKKTDIKETTYESYRTKVYKYIIPMMGDKRVQDIRKSFLKKYLSSLVSKHGFSRSSIGHHRTILQGIFEEAVDNDIITVNPAAGLKIPKQAKKPRSMELYSIDLLLEFLEKIKPFKMATMIILCLYHGLRRGEACGLRWSDIDWENGIIYVRNQRTTIKGKVVEGPLKTANSERKLYLTDRSTEILRAELERQERNKKLLGSAYHDTGYVLVNDNGLPYNPNSRSNEMAKIFYLRFLAGHTQHREAVSGIQTGHRSDYRRGCEVPGVAADVRRRAGQDVPCAEQGRRGDVGGCAACRERHWRVQRPEGDGKSPCESPEGIQA